MESPKVLATGLLTECLQIMYVGVSADTLLEKQGKKRRTVNKIYSSFDNQIVWHGQISKIIGWWRYIERQSAEFCDGFYWNGYASSVGSEGTGRGKGEREFVEERKKVLESPLSDLETMHSEQ